MKHLKCISTPETNMFNEGGVYRITAETDSMFSFIDALGCERFITKDTMRFVAAHDEGRPMDSALYAKFEEVEI